MYYRMEVVIMHKSSGLFGKSVIVLFFLFFFLFFVSDVSAVDHSVSGSSFTDIFDIIGSSSSGDVIVLVITMLFSDIHGKIFVAYRSTLTMLVDCSAVNDSRDNMEYKDVIRSFGTFY